MTKPAAVARLWRMFALAAGLALGVAGPAAAVEWKLGHILPPDHPGNRALEAAAKEIAEKTQGRIDIKVFPAGQIGNAKEVITGMTLGAIRELVPRLEADGLIKTVPQRGMQIAHVDVNLVRNAFQFRLFIEREAAALYAVNATDSELASLRDKVATLEARSLEHARLDEEARQLRAALGQAKAEVARLRDALQRALARPDVAAKLTDLGVEQRSLSAAELAEFGPAEIRRWAEAVRRSGAQVD